MPQWCGACEEWRVSQESTIYPDECVCPSQVAVWEDDDLEIYGCPVRFIPGNILDWWDQYSYETEFNTGIPYNERSSRFLAAISEYKYWSNHWNEVKKPQPQNSLNSIKTLWQQKTSKSS